MKYIYAKQIILPEEVIPKAYLEITEDGRFGNISTEQPEEAGELIDYSAYTIAPGLIDSHIHGFHGADVMDGTHEALETIAEGLLSCGVTAWLPTTLTASREQLSEICQSFSQYKAQTPQAQMLGLFLEGPFFSEAYKGAQNATYMHKPSLATFQEWKEAAQGHIKKLALAAEREGAIDFIQAMSQEGIHVYQGHSAATYEEAQAGVKAGAKGFIHTFNGMSGFHHRQPGMMGAALALNDIYTEVIADGHHVHPAAIEILYKCQGPQRMLLVSDCMRAGGLPDGISRLGEFEVIVEDGTARLTSNGSLAGSILKLIDAVRNIVEWKIATLPEALRMASLTPAEALGIEDQSGQIKKGLEANFIVLDDDIHLQATYLKGDCVYQQV